MKSVHLFKKKANEAKRRQKKPKIFQKEETDNGKYGKMYLREQIRFFTLTNATTCFTIKLIFFRQFKHNLYINNFV